MITALWLFENHKKHLALAKYYQELLERPGDQTINDIPQVSQQILDNEKALQECETYLLYYDLIQMILTDEEKWLVEHIFIKEETYYNLISYPDSPVKDYSRPTISRHKKRLLEKADTFLNEARIKEKQLES